MGIDPYPLVPKSDTLATRLLQTRYVNGNCVHCDFARSIYLYLVLRHSVLMKGE